MYHESIPKARANQAGELGVKPYMAGKCKGNNVCCLLKPYQYFMSLFPLAAWGRRMCEFWRP